MNAVRALSYLRRLPSPPVTSTNTVVDLVSTLNDEIQNQFHGTELAGLMRANHFTSIVQHVLVDGGLPTWAPMDIYAVFRELLDPHTSPAIPVVVTNTSFPSPFYASLLAGKVATFGSYAAAGALTASATPAATQIHQEALINAVRTIFPSAELSISTQSDPEERWSRPLLTVETGIRDAEKLSALEDEFYEEVENHETLTAALNEMTVLFL